MTKPTCRVDTPVAQAYHSKILITHSATTKEIIQSALFIQSVINIGSRLLLFLKCHKGRPTLSISQYFIAHSNASFNSNNFIIAALLVLFQQAQYQQSKQEIVIDKVMQAVKVRTLDNKIKVCPKLFRVNHRHDIK